MFLRSHAAALAATALCASSASAGLFLDRADWVNALGGDVTSPDYAAFSNTTFTNGVPVDLGGNYTVTAEGGNATLNQVPNFIFGFSSTGLQTVTFEFPEPINGFAANWSNTFVEDGFSVSTPSNTYALNEISDDLDALFIGFTEDTPFTTIIFSATNDPGTDFVFFNTFEFGVPAPGAVAMLLPIGLASARRRR